MSYMPEDDKQRKMIPLFEYLSRYFPKAHREVAKVCVVNNVRYNPDKAPTDINWARGKSPNQLGSAFRHMMERQVDGKVFEDVPPEVAKLTGIERVYVLAEAMWRIGAQLELDIESQEAKVPYRPLVADKVADTVAHAEREKGPLTPAQREYAVNAATAYFTRQEQEVVRCAIVGAPAPQDYCECGNCTQARLIATTGV